jgi:hypothetical protein
MGGGAPGASFPNPGDSVTGEIVAMRVQQQRAYKPGGKGDLLFWENGEPRNMDVITLATEQRNDATDDGNRDLYVKSRNMAKPIAAAVRAAGARDLEAGGTLTVTFTAYGEPDRPSSPAPKQYTAVYQPPAPGTRRPQQDQSWPPEPSWDSEPPY